MKSIKENYNYDKDSDLDFIDIFLAIWKSKHIIITTTAIACVLIVLYALSLPNIYRSSALLAPAPNSAGSLSGISSQYSDIAGLAGISLPSGGGEVDKVAIGIAIVKSYELMLKNNLYFKLIASKNWNAENNSLIIDPDIYDISSSKWVSEAKFSVDGKPSIQSSHRNFPSHFSVSQDKKTGFISLSFSHYSPHVAKEFLDVIITQINEITRAEDIAIAKNTILFLEKEAKRNQLTNIRVGINNAIQKQVEIISSANSSPQYLFKILSKPIAPEVKAQPSRAFICIIGALLGFILSVSFVLIRHFFFKKA